MLSKEDYDNIVSEVNKICLPKDKVQRKKVRPACEGEIGDYGRVMVPVEPPAEPGLTDSYTVRRSSRKIKMLLSQFE